MRLEVVRSDRAGADKRGSVVRVKDYLNTIGDLDAYTPVYDVANCMFGWSYKQASRVAMIDTVGCNVECWFCYQSGRSVDSVDMSPEEIAREFQHHGDNNPVWRVSGGEPTRQHDLPELLQELHRVGGARRLLHLNTNGYDVYSVPQLPNLLVELSIKGVTEDAVAYNAGLPLSLDAQLDAVERLCADGHNVMLNLVTAIPLTVPYESAVAGIEAIGIRLRRIEWSLPLRVTPVVLKHYGWCQDWPVTDDLSDEWFAWVRREYDWIDVVQPKGTWVQ